MIRIIAALLLVVTFVTTDTAPAHADDSIVWRVQKELNRQGCDAGEPDGLIGYQTQQALMCIQRRHDLRVTGRINGRTLRAIFGDRNGKDDWSDDEQPETIGIVSPRSFPLCGEVVVASGKKKYGRVRAQGNAIEVWQTDVAHRYGTSYVDWGRAQASKVRCRPACATCRVSFECEVTATPCREE
jgi:peptidoglycan hydrolase-like protein with peptidoglycan-binding domain